MEKKPNSIRSNQTSSKGLIVESRKNQDVSTKQWPRNGRRRESSNYSNSSKSEPIRSSNKQTAQRFNFDKRYRQNGDGYQRSFGPSTTSTSSDTGLDEHDEVFAVELNSVYTPGSKKQNLNHLLNFNYAPRERNDPINFTRTGNYRNHTPKKSKYNKEHFLQATCQFVVNFGFNYEPYTVCPDTLVEWNFIEQVNVQSAEEPQCPICLYPPVAAKMTRCGHVYCWPCILQYLSLSDKAWRKCPICYESIHVGHLKSTISKPHPVYNAGDYVTLQLMCREKTSLYVSKINKTKTTVFPHLFSDADELIHSKLILANVDEIMSIIERERKELKAQLDFDGLDCPESIFIQQALILLQERADQMKSLDPEQKCENNANIVAQDDQAAQIEQKMIQLKLNIDAKPFVPNIASGQSQQQHQDNEECREKSTNFVIDEESNLTLHDIDITPTVKDSNSFFFYQAADGQHLYLHSINVRMLQTMYGSLDRAPHQIIGKIVQKESCSMTEDLRKRLKYLQHLPVTSQFDVVEIVLEANVVSAEVLAKFKDELILRQKIRQRRAREERQREKHINEVNDRQIGKLLARSANIDVTSDRQFPLCGNFDSPSSFNQDDPTFVALSPTRMSDYSLSTSGHSSMGTAAGPSFATMLTGPTKAELWPTLGPTKNLSFDVTPSVVTAGNVVNQLKQYDSDMDEEEDDILARAPEFKSSFGTAIETALITKAKQKTGTGRRSGRGSNDGGGKDLSFDAVANVTTGNGCGNGGKKKKNKKTVLFSTSARPFDGK